MGQFYNKGICPRCMKPTLTIWPTAPGEKARKTCNNDRCQYVEK